MKRLLYCRFCMNVMLKMLVHLNVWVVTLCIICGRSPRMQQHSFTHTHVTLHLLHFKTATQKTRGQQV